MKILTLGLLFVFLALLLDVVMAGSCADVTGDVDVLCWKNDSTDWTDMNAYNVSYHYVEGATTEQNQFHYHSGDFHYSNPDDITNFAKGGFGRTRYRSRGNLYTGFRWNGGTTSDKRWTPIKWMGTSSITSPFNARSEFEITGDRRHLVSYGAFECEDGDNCDLGTDSVDFELTGVPSDIKYEASIDGYCGFRWNETMGSTSYESDEGTREFIQIVSPCPDNYTLGTTTTIRYEATQNQVIEYYFVTTSEEFESTAGDWIANYSNKLAEIESEYYNFSSAFNYPNSSYTEQDVEDYFSAIYSYWFDTLMCWNDSDTSCNFYVYGNSNEVNTPNFENYYGQWIWDSFNSCLGLLATLNYSSPYVSQVQNDTCKSWQEVWINNTEHYPTISKWNQNIRSHSIPGSIQSQGGWTLASIIMYNKSIISKDWLCNDTFDSLRSNYESYKADRGSNWLQDTGGATVGRDGTDIHVSNGDNTDASGWFLLDAIGLATISEICDNTGLRSNFTTDYNSIKSDFEGMYDSTNNIYSNYNSSGLFYYKTSTNDWATSPFGQCIAIALNVTNSGKTDTAISLLKNNFTDSIGFTSIATHHSCYTSYGTDGGCTAGETWDGPTWSGVDDFWCLHSFREGKDRWSYSIKSDIDWLEEMMLNISGIGTPFGSESYDSDGSQVALWGSNPYGWGGNIPTSAINDFNIFSFLSYNMTTENASEESNGVPFYNVTHPRMHRYTQAQMLSFINASGSAYQTRYDSVVATKDTDDNSSANGGTSKYWKVGTIAYHNALCYYLTNNTDCLNDAIEFLSSALNDTDDVWSALSVHNRAEMLGALGYTFDIIEPQLTDNQTEDFVNKGYNISVAVFDDDMNNYNLNVSNDNGHFIIGSLCTFMLSFKGHHSTDANFSTSSRWQKCIDMLETGLRGYINGSSEPDGFDYIEYGGEFIIPFLEAYDYAENSSLLALYDDTICGGIGKDFVYYLTDVNEIGTSGDSLRHIDYGDGNEYNGIFPFVMNFYARQCNQPVNYWHSLYQYNQTDNYNSYSLVFALDVALYNNTVGVQSPSGLSMDTELYDMAWERIIWRNGWTFTSDLIFGFGGWSSQSAGHGQQDDNSFILHYNGYPLLADSGDRNTTNEIPSGTKYHNTLTVDQKGTMNWNNDEGSTTPASLHYVGIDGFPTATTCTKSNYHTCSYISDDYKMHIEDYITSADYNEIMGVKQYYTITNWTRRIYYDKGETYFIIKDDVIDDNSHNYSFNINTQTVGVSQSGQNLTATRNSTNIQVLLLYNSSSCTWNADKERYGKKSTDEIVTLNSIDCLNTQNITIIYSIVPYILGTSINFNFLSNSTHLAINVTNSTTEEYIVYLISNLEQEIKVQSDFNTSESSEEDNTSESSGEGSGGGNSASMNINITTNKKIYKYLEPIIINVSYDLKPDILELNILKNGINVKTILFKENQNKKTIVDPDLTGEYTFKIIAKKDNLIDTSEVDIIIESFDTIIITGIIAITIIFVISGFIIWLNR